MSNTPDQLPAEWREEGRRARERYSDERIARLCETHAAELEEAIREADGQALTLAEAAAESGYAQRTLREMIANGSLPQAGRKGTPRIRRRDLPRKAKAGQGRDVQADVRRIMQRMAS